MFMMVLISISLGGVAIGSAVVARHRAQSAADLAALAAAGALPAGPTAACGQARQLATTMRAHVQACVIEDLDVVVTVTVIPNGWTGGQASAAARAGPGLRS